MKQTIILAILDGWGIGSKNDSNPIYMAGLETINYFEQNFPAGALKSSGISVGLPWKENGDSEVGHLTLGTGRILYQHFLKITRAIEDGSFFQKEALKKSFAHAKKNKSSVHLAGLLTKGNVHTSLNHIVALLEMAEKEEIQDVYLHLFTDGKDSPPRSTLQLLEELESKIKKYNRGIIATITGRYYAMDRDKSWNLTQKTFEAMMGKAPQRTREEAVGRAYNKNLNDEYVEPAIISKGSHPIQDNDAIIFFNFREDRMRQISEPFLNPEFNTFEAERPNNLSVATMTEYHANLPAEIVFPHEKIADTLGEVISKNGRNQLRVAETSKWAHITYFFNGLVENPFPEEYRVLIPSLKLVRPAEKPQMMADAITNRVMVSLKDGGFDFVLINYANPDIIAHTGDYKATIQAVKTIDKELNKLAREVLAGDHILIITSDHGNAEVLMDLKTGKSQTQHNSNPVPIYIISKTLQKQNPSKVERLPIIGLLSDVAPTILDLMKLPKPEKMTGTSLLEII